MNGSQVVDVLCEEGGKCLPTLVATSAKEFNSENAMLFTNVATGYLMHAQFKKGLFIGAAAGIGVGVACYFAARSRKKQK